MRTLEKERLQIGDESSARVMLLSATGHAQWITSEALIRGCCKSKSRPPVGLWARHPYGIASGRR
jgi:hypothetical protein